ncbi:MAG: hypothetical protein M8357_14500 [Desulfobulbaceae bacterium]|nr:hypothetical protein [Desulfobulbaceae bacterium]
MCDLRWYNNVIARLIIHGALSCSINWDRTVRIWFMVIRNHYFHQLINWQE